jgi:hypothetical protein
VVLLLVLAAAMPSTGEPSSTLSFSAVADSRLVSANFTVEPGIIFPQLIDAGSSVAQAQLSSLGDSKAFASDPYPSESAVLLPGLVAGLTSGATSGIVPEYPLIASSSFPAKPDQRVALANLSLSAQSAPDRTTGSAGNGLNEAVASAERDPGSGTVTVKATTAAAALSLPGLLSLDGVRSTATAKQAPGGKVELSSSFDIGALVIAGQRVSLSGLLGSSGEGLDLGSTAVGLLLQQLAASGTTIDVLPAEKTADTVLSAGLRIRTVTPAPDLPPLPPLPDTGLSSVPALAAVLALPGGLSGIQDIVTEVVIGRASAHIEARTIGGEVDGDAADVPSIGSPGNGVGTGGLGTTVGLPPIGSPSAPGATPSPTAPTAMSRTSTIAEVSSDPFYAALLLAGVACVGAFVLIGKLGVREA